MAASAAIIVHLGRTQLRGMERYCTFPEVLMIDGHLIDDGLTYSIFCDAEYFLSAQDCQCAPILDTGSTACNPCAAGWYSSLSGASLRCQRV
jgi:hypothetical protein